MTRKTSIDVYHQIEAEGLLSKRRWEVYSYLFKNGPLTQIELNEKLAKGVSHSYTPRFSELEKMGLIEIVAERPCRVTGRFVLVWDVTDQLPRKLEKQKELTTREAFVLMREFILETTQATEVSKFMRVDEYQELWEFLQKRVNNTKH